MEMTFFPGGKQKPDNNQATLSQTRVRQLLFNVMSVCVCVCVIVCLSVCLSKEGDIFLFTYYLLLLVGYSYWKRIIIFF